MVRFFMPAPWCREPWTGCARDYFRARMPYAQEQDATPALRPYLLDISPITDRVTWGGDPPPERLTHGC